MNRELYQFAIRGFLEENTELFIKRLAILCEKSERTEKIFEPYLIHVTIRDNETFRNIVQSVVDKCYKEYSPRPGIEITEVTPQNQGVIVRYKYTNQNGEEISDNTIFVESNKFGKAVECDYV